MVSSNAQRSGTNSLASTSFFYEEIDVKERNKIFTTKIEKMLTDELLNKVDEGQIDDFNNWIL